jgi:hypothetical protein
MRETLPAVVALVAMTSCGALAGASAQDARADCAGVGDDDRPKPIPPGLASRALRLFYATPVDPEQVEKSTVYRCMHGAVWLCNYGANLSCRQG